MKYERIQLTNWCLAGGQSYTYLYAEDTEALSNGDFENFTGYQPDDWDDTGSVDTNTNTDAYNGTYSCSVYDSTSGDSEGIYQDGIIGNFGNKRLVFNFYGKALSSDHSCYLEFSEEGQSIETGTVALTTSAWTRGAIALTGTADCGSDATSHDVTIKFFPVNPPVAGSGYSLIDYAFIYAGISTVNLPNEQDSTKRWLFEDTTALTEKTSVALCEAAAGSYYVDTTNHLLYVHPTGSADPDNTTIYWVYPGDGDELPAPAAPTLAQSELDHTLLSYDFIVMDARTGAWYQGEYDASAIFVDQVENKPYIGTRQGKLKTIEEADGEELATMRWKSKDFDFGVRGVYKTIAKMDFDVDTKGDDMTVEVYGEDEIKESITLNTSGRERVTKYIAPATYRYFSVEFVCTSTNRPIIYGYTFYYDVESRK